LRKNYVIAGGIVGAIFTGLAVFAFNYTYQERVFVDLGWGFGTWVTVEQHLHPLIGVVLLIIAILGFFVMTYGFAVKES